MTYGHPKMNYSMSPEIAIAVMLALFLSAMQAASSDEIQNSLNFKCVEKFEVPPNWVTVSPKSTDTAYIIHPAKSKQTVITISWPRKVRSEEQADLEKALTEPSDKSFPFSRLSRLWRICQPYKGMQVPPEQMYMRCVRGKNKTFLMAEGAGHSDKGGLHIVNAFEVFNLCGNELIGVSCVTTLRVRDKMLYHDLAVRAVQNIEWK